VLSASPAFNETTRVRRPRNWRDATPYTVRLCACSHCDEKQDLARCQYIKRGFEFLRMGLGRVELPTSRLSGASDFPGNFGIAPLFTLTARQSAAIRATRCRRLPVQFDTNSAPTNSTIVKS